MSVNQWTVLSGADRLAASPEAYLSGGRIGLITNPTGITRDFRPVSDVCSKLPGTKLAALFACEHGIRGERQAGVTFDDETDPVLGIPVYSLYGKRKVPTEEMMENLDAVVFDLQDVGARFYTYLTTLVNMMQTCAACGKELIVLDRPNPIGGIISEGGILRESFLSSIGVWKIPIRSGLTIGEFAKLANDQMGIGCRLSIVPLEGWRREMEYAETGLPWVMPSPNMPTPDTARVYPGTCLFEGTNLSEGRGTTKPFEMIGAPWLNGSKVAEALNALRLPGVVFHPVYFTPSFSKHQGELCGGVQLFVRDPKAFRAVRAGLSMLACILEMYPDRFEWRKPSREGAKPFIDLLTGSDLVRTKLGEIGAEAIAGQWEAECAEWEKQRKPYLIYQ